MTSHCTDLRGIPRMIKIQHRCAWRGARGIAVAAAILLSGCGLAPQREEEINVAAGPRADESPHALAARRSKRIPAWVPVHPRSRVESVFSTDPDDDEGNGFFRQRVPDDPMVMAVFFSRSLQGKGFKVQSSPELDAPAQAYDLVGVETESGEKQVVVALSSENGLTDAVVRYQW